MKKILFLTVLFPALVFAQTSGQNYLKTTTYKIPTAVSIDKPTIDTAAITITYFDGLGRPIQKRDYQQSNSGKDIVTVMEYDAFGRQPKEYLPYANSVPLLNFDDSPNQSLYYSTASQASTTNPHEATTNAYSEKLFESSPLNTLLKEAAPGNDWVMGGGHEIRYEDQANIANEVKNYTVKMSRMNCGMYTTNLMDDGYYDADQLYKKVTKNENWTSGDDNTTQEFKDKQGRIILKRTFEGGPLDTYYIYDPYGNLTYVLPPLASAESNITPAVLDEMGYQYQYDGRNRMVAKKLPGKQWEYTLYDKQDKPIVTYPANDPFGGAGEGCLFSKYDVFGRICYTGWFPVTFDPSSYCTLQTLDCIADAKEAHRTVDAQTIDSIQLNYTQNNNPIGLKLLSINYYDNYNATGLSDPQTSVFGITPLFNVKGLQTAVWARVLTSASGTEHEITSTYYDSKSRPIYIDTGNYLGGYTRISTQYDFPGKVLKTQTKQKRGTSGSVLTTTEEFVYTPQDRLSKHFHYVNNNVKEVLACNNYDELGNLITKNVGGTSEACEGLQKVDYRYNVRGWLTNINDTANLEETGAPADLFAFKINYNAPDDPTIGGALFNGNISETFWRTGSDNVLRKYSYKYDALNRLNDAVYQKPGTTVPVTNSYNESIKYDSNGNITHLGRTGNYDSDVDTHEIDNLAYFYDPSKPNQLLKVTDSTNDPNGFKDDSNGTNDTMDDYKYDANGNMIADENKGIQDIFYNHMNLPVKIVFASGEIDYLYNALGEKLKKTVIDSQTTTTDYLKGFQYKNSILQFFPTAEGYVNYTPGEGLANNYNYVYNYLDHLGNIRMSYSKDPSDNILKILEENHYYPFGLKHTNYNFDKKAYEKNDLLLHIAGVPVGGSVTYDYKYNGKEFQDELGLNVYDYDARNYDPALGRWMNIDPLAEKMRRWSPYNYCFNNPMSFTDPDGMNPNWYENKKTGNVQYKPGSAERTGYTNLGSSTNLVAGTGQGVQLNSNGTATDLNSGKDYGANKTVVVNSSTGTTVSTAKGSEALETASKVTDGVDAVAKSFEGGLNANAPASVIGGGVAKVTGTLGIAVNAAQVGVGVYNDGGEFGPNAQAATGTAVGSMIGAEAGGVVGMEVGAAIGTMICPVIGTAIGAVVGGIGGALIGGAAGGEMGGQIATEVIGQ